MRDRHRAAMACQIVHDSLPERGFTHAFKLTADDQVAGYGTLVGFGDEPKETVDEFYVLEEHRPRAPALFDALLDASGATRVRAQTNDPLLSTMLWDTCHSVRREAILFEDGPETRLSVPGATFREVTEADRAALPEAARADVGTWMIECDGRLAASGGVLTHYNPPYGDVYMAVEPEYRRRGLGSYLVQELRRVARGRGLVPAARCNPANTASRATLERGGMRVCGAILVGTVRQRR